MSPLTAVYAILRENQVPKDFLDSLKYLEGLDKSKLMAVMQLLTQVKTDKLGLLDEGYLARQESHGLLMQDMIQSVNGTAEAKVLKVDCVHAFRWIVRRYTTKIGIEVIGQVDGVPVGVIGLGKYSMMQFLDTSFSYSSSTTYNGEQLKAIRALNKHFVDWTTWTLEDCQKFSVGVSSALDTPVEVVHVTKEFYRFCVALLNVVKLRLVDESIRVESISSKLATIKGFMSYNKKLRGLYAIESITAVLKQILPNTHCIDEPLFAFSPLSYLLTYGIEVSVPEEFLESHKNEYSDFKKGSMDANLLFINVAKTMEKPIQFRNLKNMEAFYSMHLANRSYRSTVKMTQEYDTTFFVGPFERNVRRTIYLNTLFAGFAYVGLGTGSEPKDSKMDPNNRDKIFYNIGIGDGISSTANFVDLIKKIVCPTTVTEIVIYAPIIKYEGVSVLTTFLIDNNFQGVRVHPSDQAHSQYFPLHFTKKESKGTDFYTAFGSLPSAQCSTILSVLYFNEITRVIKAEREYMQRVQLGVDNIFTGKFVSVSKLPDEMVQLKVAERMEDDFEIVDKRDSDYSYGGNY